MTASLSIGIVYRWPVRSCSQHTNQSLYVDGGEGEPNPKVDRVLSRFLGVLLFSRLFLPMCTFVDSFIILYILILI